MFNPLLWAAAVTPDQIRAHPGDRSRYASVGGVNLATSALAGGAVVSATSMGFPLIATLPLALIGTAWAAFVLFLDRSMLVPTGHSSKRVVACRLVLAIALGVVTSEPLLARYFDKDITRFYADQDVTTVENEVARAIKALDNRITETSSLLDDQQHTADADKTAATNARALADEERDSSVGGRQAGAGPVWERKDHEAHALELKAEHSVSIVESTQNELKQLQARREETITSIREQTTTRLAASHGLAARLNAVDNVAGKSRHILLGIFLTIVDSAAVIAKIFSPKSSLERALTNGEEAEEFAYLETFPDRLHAEATTIRLRLTLGNKKQEIRYNTDLQRSHHRADLTAKLYRLFGFGR